MQTKPREKETIISYVKVENPTKEKARQARATHAQTRIDRAIPSTPNADQQEITLGFCARHTVTKPAVHTRIQ